ncbi:MAG TPA: hypothetical protein VFD32_14780 [Dehalococcoidia bacterium]|nr:hypothetical protein [Dehalococcoidia bacterium]
MSRCSAASRRRLLSSMLLLIGLLAAAAPRLRLAVPATAQTSLPDAVAALLPAGAQIQDAQAADFTNAGEQGWAVLYATPTDIPGATALSNWSVLIALPSGSGFSLGATATVKDANVAGMTVADVAGTPAVALTAGVGAHAAQMTVVRWDGAAFATVFDGTTDTPGYDFKDIDGDGQPEVVEAVSPYCRDYAESPQIVVVYKWDGARFSEWAGPYPQDLIAERLAYAQKVTTQMSDWDQDAQACVWGVVAFLTGRSGDTAGADAACNQAKAISPAWEDPHDCPAYILSPANKVRLFYGLIDQQRFFEAWDQLSSAYQAKHGDESAWEQGYKATRSVTVEDIQPATGEPPVVAVTFTATDATDGGTITRRFSGTWTLVLEDGVWKLDTANIQQVP